MQQFSNSSELLSILCSHKNVMIISQTVRVIVLTNKQTHTSTDKHYWKQYNLCYAIAGRVRGCCTVTSFGDLLIRFDRCIARTMPLQDVRLSVRPSQASIESGMTVCIVQQPPLPQQSFFQRSFNSHHGSTSGRPSPEAYPSCCSPPDSNLANYM